MREIDEEILVALLELWNGSPKEVSEHIESSDNNQYVYERLKALKEEDFVRKRSKGVYLLTEDGLEYIEQNNLKDENLNALDYLGQLANKLYDKSETSENSDIDINVVDKRGNDFLQVTLDREETKKGLEKLSREIKIENYEFLSNIKKKIGGFG